MHKPEEEPEDVPPVEKKEKINVIPSQEILQYIEFVKKFLL